MSSLSDILPDCKKQVYEQSLRWACVFCVHGSFIFYVQRFAGIPSTMGLFLLINVSTCVKG